MSEWLRLKLAKILLAVARALQASAKAIIDLVAGWMEISLF